MRKTIDFMKLHYLKFYDVLKEIFSSNIELHIEHFEANWIPPRVLFNFPTFLPALIVYFEAPLKNKTSKCLLHLIETDEEEYLATIEYESEYRKYTIRALLEPETVEKILELTEVEE